MGSAHNKIHHALYLIDNILGAIRRKNFKIQTLVVLHEGKDVRINHHLPRAFF